MKPEVQRALIGAANRMCRSPSLEFQRAILRSSKRLLLAPGMLAELSRVASRLGPHATVWGWLNNQPGRARREAGIALLRWVAEPKRWECPEVSGPKRSRLPRCRKGCS